MLVTLSVRRLQGAEVAGAAASSAVFFVKVGSQHKVSELQATLRKLFGLEPDAKVPLLLNGVELSPAVSPTEVRMRNLPCFASRALRHRLRMCEPLCPCFASTRLACILVP
jgi:hypothetical protein